MFQVKENASKQTIIIICLFRSIIDVSAAGLFQKMNLRTVLSHFVFLHSQSKWSPKHPAIV